MKNLPKQYVLLPQFPKTRVTKSAGTANLEPENHDSTRRVSSQHPFIASTPIRNVSGSQLIESFESANQQIVGGLPRQNLRKCQPDIFTGDATLFHPWKAPFKATIKDADVSPI